MFIGEYKHNIDAKGRMAVPSKFRQILKKGAVVTRGLDNCLFLYPKEKWEEMAQKFANLPISQAKARAFARHMLAGAMQVEFDNQGRITLPDYLRQFAVIKKRAVIAGLFDRLEIWDEASWSKYKTSTEKSSDDIAESLSELGV
ncbi:division/cell wall cluster transcriptional repressor MraZ [Candidatus Falkowbacteria bacterium]|nr:division/cell wall cluster transcriptional repressor MraZ [Candidatus Falkowbacteria bacterium]